MIDLNAVRSLVVPPPVVEAPAPVPVKLDLGGGRNPREGFTSVDKFPSPEVGVVCDLLQFPWPMETGSVDELHCSHFVEHIPKGLRLRFFQEAWRVLKPGGLMTVITPAGERHLQDPTHEAPEVVFGFYAYLSKSWREEQKLDNGYLTAGQFDLTCNFVSQSVGVLYHPNIAQRNDEFRNFAQQHYVNAILDRHVTLQAVK